MRSSESTETIMVMLAIAIIAGLAGGFFLIKLDDRNAVPSFPEHSATAVDGMPSPAVSNGT